MIRQPVETFWGTAENEQSYQGLIRTTVDPTGTPPSFGITVSTDVDGPSAWVAGVWSGSWNATTERTLAVTPTLGLSAASPALTIPAANGVYKIWAKVTVGSETWTEPVFEVRIPS